MNTETRLSQKIQQSASDFVTLCCMFVQAARMRYVYEDTPYCLNLIDTPGHVDFSYEVLQSSNPLKIKIPSFNSNMDFLHCGRYE